MNANRVRSLAGLVLTAALAACGPEEEAMVAPTPMFAAEAWGEGADSAAWESAAAAAIAAEGAPLLTQVPGDIAEWCPGYTAASEAERARFWTALLQYLAPRGSAGCIGGTPDALLTGNANLSCAVRSMVQGMTRDGVISAGGRGLAALWSPFRRNDESAEVADWVKNQSYCQG